LSDLAIRTFEAYFNRLVSGETGLLTESEIAPVVSLPDADALADKYRIAGLGQLPQAVMIKLNGGLGTGMGLEKAKSLLPVRGSRTFLDIIAEQAIAGNIALVLMNSFSTESDTRGAIRPHLAKSPMLFRDFRQNQVPKIMVADHSPGEWPQDTDNEWCPPGHGDLYPALLATGLLDKLIAEGRRYAFVSNSDNLGATLDPAILGFFADSKAPFLMEVCDRTEADRKGGHLALTLSGQLVLREKAQCPASEEAQFQDITRYKYFNTNNMWIDLAAIRDIMTSRDGVLDLPMIVNTKTIDPRDDSSPKVFQLETAMGSAIAVIPGSQAIRVTRGRFSPVKTTSDLLAVQSDAYRLGDDHVLALDDRRAGRPPVIRLDDAYFKKVDQFFERFPAGVPSLIECDSLEVKGDVVFGKGVKIKGSCVIHNTTTKQVRIADDKQITGVIRY
jgi:UTP--glucose-1-phosphate uridylyltransferase